jgi:hypothetical protein
VTTETIRSDYPAFVTREVHNRGTRYIGHRAVDLDSQRMFLMLVTGWSGNCGEWIALPIGEDEIAWSYLAEKMPAIETHGGDRPGFVALLAEFGIRVFNWELGDED